jgi:addiction module HigA family antidote
MNNIPFAYSIHPGDTLLTEFMQPMGLTAYRLAKDLHVSLPRVNDLVRGKGSITADTALRLAIYFGNSAEFWLGLQTDHDIWIAATNKSQLKTLRKVKPRPIAA